MAEIDYEELMADDLAPRTSLDLFGHTDAEAQLLKAYNADRLHHGWLITGPKGVGKATLAHRFARFLVCQPPKDDGAGLFGDALAPEEAHDMATDAENPTAARAMNGSHGNIRTLVRSVDDKTKKRRTVIRVDEVRMLIDFFNQTASEDGWRVAIVDSVDEMNPSAANALLKVLEEPPERSILLLVSHAPGRLLPTIRSRCQKLALTPLGENEMTAFLASRHGELPANDAAQIARLAGGAPGRALLYVEEEALALYDAMLDVIATMPALDRPKLDLLADQLTPQKAEARFFMLLDLYEGWLARTIRSGATGQGHSPMISAEQTATRAALSIGVQPLMDAARRLQELRSATMGLHLDRKLLILTLFEELNSAIAKSAA